MGSHASFAPSSAARWLLCPASAILSASLPNPESEASAEGTRVHKLIEEAIGGTPVPSHENETVTYGIELVLDFVRKLGGNVLPEQKVVLSDDVWGTVDVLQPLPGVTTILDYKNGAMDVQAAGNAQLMTYAAGALEQHGPSKHYRLVIVQPNSRTAGDMPDVKQSIVALEDVEAHRDRVLEAVRRGLGGEAPHPGRHCRYCPAFGNCDATRETVGRILAAVRFHPSEIPDRLAGDILRTLRGLDDFRKGLEKDVMKRFAGGATIEGVNIGTTSAHRKWSDERMAVTELMQLYGVNGVDPVTPATAEKMGQAGKELAGRLAFKPPGNPSLKY